jgi:hypothetical protein
LVKVSSVGHRTAIALLYVSAAGLADFGFPACHPQLGS